MPHGSNLGGMQQEDGPIFPHAFVLHSSSSSLLFFYATSTLISPTPFLFKVLCIRRNLPNVLSASTAHGFAFMAPGRGGSNNAVTASTSPAAAAVHSSLSREAEPGSEAGEIGRGRSDNNGSAVSSANKGLFQQRRRLRVLLVESCRRFAASSVGMEQWNNTMLLIPLGIF